MRWTSLQFRLPLAIAICLAALGGALGSYDASIARREAIARARLQMLGETRAKAAELQNRLDTAMDAARTFAQELTAIHSSGLRLSRAQANAILRQVLVENPEFLGTYTLWEPGAFDGEDARYRGTPGHDATGRFLPYWNRGPQGAIHLDPIVGYETPGPGDFYLIPRRTRREAILEPYAYPVQGEQVLMVSLVAPILEEGRFRGMAGVDLRVDFLQKLCDQVDLYGGSATLALLTQSGSVAGATGRPGRPGPPSRVQADLDLPALRAAGRDAVISSQGSLYAFTPVPVGRTGTPWAVVLQVPERAVTAPAIARVRRMGLISAAFLALATGLLILLLKLLLLRRIEHLAEATRTFAAGGLDARCPVEGGDELGHLAEAFNAMAGEIQATLEELKEKKLLLAATLDNSFQLYGLLTREGRIITANRAALALIGKPLEAVEGMLFWEAPWWDHDPDEGGRIREAVSRASQGEFIRLETHHRAADGGLRTLDFSLSPLRDGTGGFLHLIAEGRDMTLLKSAESALRRSEENYRSIVETAPLGIFRSGPAGRFVNRCLLDQFGFKDLEEYLAHDETSDLDWVLPGQRKAFAEALQRDGHIQSFEAELRTRNGDTRWFLFYAHMEQDGGVSGFTVDITPGKKAQAEHERILEQLHHTQRLDAVGQLAGGVAHDFNNVLGGIMGAAELLSGPGLDEVQRRRYLELVLSASSRAADLVRKLLQFSRKGEKASSSIDVGRVVEDALAILRRTLDKRIAVNLVNEAARTVVIGDDAMLQNVFLNMGINASHAMPEGGSLTFRLSNLHLDQVYCEASPYDLAPGPFLEVEVRDTGCGMSAEVQRRIFEPFFTTKEQGKGTGLGLAAAYGTIQDHHGAITVYSEVGEGTVFHVYLPLSAATAAVPHPDEAPVPGAGTILLVEDEEILRVTGVHLLESLGYRVITAADGQEGVDCFARHRDTIDLVILDMVMPVLGGRQAFARLRELDPEVKVLLASGFTKVEDLDALMREGLAGFIHKPFRSVELSRVIARLLLPGAPTLASGSIPSQEFG